MREKIDQFFRGRRKLVLGIFFIALSSLFFIIAKVYPSFNGPTKKLYWGTFLFGFGITMLLIFRKSSNKESSEKKENVTFSGPKAYQELTKELVSRLKEISKYRVRAYAFLVLGWGICFVLKLLDYPPYSNPIYSIPIFGIALLGSTAKLEEEYEVDVKTVDCVAQGMAIEKKLSSRHENLFHDFAKGYDGSKMWVFAFIRTSPHLMILYSFLQSVTFNFIVQKFSVPRWSLPILEWHSFF